MSNVPTIAEVRAASTFAIRHDICQWGLKIASDDRYGYVIWKSSVSSTHTCPICKGRKPGHDFGWNCIGFSFATWHHGGLIPSNCNCGVIDNDTGTKMLKMSVSDMLATAQKHIGVKELKIIYNGGKHIPASMLEPGDILLEYSGSTYKHTFVYIGGGKRVHSTGSSGTVPKAKQICSGKYPSSGCKIAIRYTGTRSYISIGARGDAVKKVQAIVGVTADGIFGEKTLAAVKKYQTAKGLTADGLVGAKTLAAMEKAVVKKAYIGVYPSLHVNYSAEQVKTWAIKWGKWIAADNSFHYGKGDNAHHNGCYFCGTQPNSKKNLKDCDKTYCCNPFVHACYSHGGLVPAMSALCRKGKSYGFSKNEGYAKSALFKSVGKDATLQAGDVLCSDHHVALYIGGGKVVQAGHEDDNVKGSKKWNSSISVGTWKGYTRVYRFIGSVNADILIRFGEYSDRVVFLQRYLNWFNGKKVLVEDGIFGQKTLEYLKAFQISQKIAADGIVGPNTIAKMKGVVK